MPRSRQIRSRTEILQRRQLDRQRYLFTSIVLTLIALLSTSSAQALSTSYGGADDPSLHGATGSLTIDGPIDSRSGTFDVTWSMNFDGYEGSAGNHQYLTEVAFKAFTRMSAVTLDGISWNSADAATASALFFPSNVSGNGCADSSEAGMVCVTLDPMVDATMGGRLIAEFTVTGDLDISEWSYRGKFGPERGWVSSESSAPVPEPTAAMVFGAGLLTVGWSLRNKQR
jgi:hypothetical protein